MSHSNYITPRLGLRTAAVATGWIWGVYLLGFYLPKAHAEQESLQDPKAIVGSMLLVGTFYGVTAWICWLSTVIPGTLPRSLLRLGALVAGSYVLDRYQSDGQWIKFVINLGGMIISQSVLFFLLRIPEWQFGATPREVQGRQFSIGEILIGTTGIALLLGLAIRFQTPINARDYWLVLMGLWILFPLIAACTCMAALQRNISQGMFCLTIALLLAVCGAVGLAFLERMFADPPKTYSTMFAVQYGMIALGNLIMMFLLPLAGRLDARDT